jgi:hypothetical protein
LISIIREQNEAVRNSRRGDESVIQSERLPFGLPPVSEQAGAARDPDGYVVAVEFRQQRPRRSPLVGSHARVHFADDDRGTAQSRPSGYQSSQQLPLAQFSTEGENEDVGVRQVRGHSLGFPAGLNALQTSLRFGAHAAHPFPGVVDLGTIFRLPDRLGSVKSNSSSSRCRLSSRFASSTRNGVRFLMVVLLRTGRSLCGF